MSVIITYVASYVANYSRSQLLMCDYNLLITSGTVYSFSYTNVAEAIYVAAT